MPRVGPDDARKAVAAFLTAETIEVERRDVTVWSSPTAFTRVALEHAEEPARSRVALRLSGRATTVADVLSPRERAAFAEALQRAVADALKERHALPARGID
jgi:uncharacterized membrane protein